MIAIFLLSALVKFVSDCLLANLFRLFE